MEKKRKKKGPERRRYLRFTPEKPIPVDYEVILSAERKKRKPGKKGRGKNVSGGGIFIELSALKKGEVEELLEGKKLLALKIKLPDLDHEIGAFGKTVWMEKLESNVWAAGVIFVEIGVDDRDEIMDYVLRSYAESV